MEGPVYLLLLVCSLGMAQGCSVSSECADSQCCVLPVIGRRKLLQAVAPSGITNNCAPMPQVGQGCIARPSLVPGTRPEQPGFACPCPAGTTCVPNGGYEVPQGPTGTCELSQKPVSSRWSKLREKWQAFLRRVTRGIMESIKQRQ